MPYQITVYDKHLHRQVIFSDDKVTLMELLGENGIYFRANCGGTGRCRQCEVLVDGRRRRACQVWVQQNMKVVLPFAFENSVKAVINAEDSGKLLQISGQKRYMHDEKKVTVVVDIGTTTVGMALLDDAGQIVETQGFQNPQCRYGADVAARIQIASEPAGLQQLCRCLLEKLDWYITKILADYKQKKNLAANPQIKAVYLAGNPAMLHIALQYSPKGMGSYPFAPVFLDEQEKETVFAGQAVKMYSLPCASAYIGSDVTVGAYFYQMHQKNKPCLYLDLGTNGEMLLGNKDRMLSASVAAGPAFEQAMYASEIMQAISELLKNGAMDMHGTLQEPYFSNGYVYHNTVITQEDIRQIQLAKAAVRAGIAILLQKYKITANEIEQVYIAGGFGFHLQMESAFVIGMLPEAFRGRIQVVGNASLNGSVACLDNIIQLQNFCKRICAVDLAMEKTFMDTYLAEIDFKKSKI